MDGQTPIPNSKLFLILRKKSKHDDYDAKGFNLEERMQGVHQAIFFWSKYLELLQDALATEGMMEREVDKRTGAGADPVLTVMVNSELSLKAELLIFQFASIQTLIWS